MATSNPQAPHTGGLLALIAHGSSRERWRRPLDRLAERLAERTGAGSVQLCFMELCEPTLEQLVGRARAAGVERIDVLPLFWSAGGHVERDIAPQVAALQARWPDITLRLLPAVGEHPALLDALTAVARETIGGA